MLALGLALAALIGLSLGLLGGGGSILTVPILVYVLGFAPKPAIAMSLPVVGTTSLVGALRHRRAGNVNLRVAFLFGLIAMVGSYLGARLGVLIRGSVQLALLAVVMLVAAVSMFRSSGRDDKCDDVASPSRATLALVPTILVGLGVGGLTGLVGIGGGFLIVPALVVLSKVPMKQAVGTSLLVIAMNSASGFLGYLGKVFIDWQLLLLFTAVAVVGVLAGTHVVQFVSQAALKRAFAVFLVLMGTLVLYENRGALLPASNGPPRSAR